MWMLLVAWTSAEAADLEGNPSFGLYPGSAGLLTRPSRLGWEADPLVAVGVSLDVGAPEVDLSGRGERWTRALVLALPTSAQHDESFDATMDDDALTTWSWDGSVDPFVGLGLARVGDRSAVGVSLVLDLDLEVAPASLSGLDVVSQPGASTITWVDGRPTPGEGSTGVATGQDLDLAFSTGVSSLEGAARPRLDFVARWVRTGEFVRVAEGVAIPYATGYEPPPGEGMFSVDHVEGANPDPFWWLPNRSAATVGAVVGVDRGGTLRDPRLRLEAGVSGGPTWPTFSETLSVQGRYTEYRTRSRAQYVGFGDRVAGHLGATWGWTADDDDEAADPPDVRVRSGWRLDGFRERHRPDLCGDGCASTEGRTEYLKLVVPTAFELRWSERVTALAGLSPSAHLYRYRHQLDVAGEPIHDLTDQEVVVGLGVRAGLRYEHRGWVLGASFTGFTAGGSTASLGAAGGLGGAFSGATVAEPPPLPKELALPGPSLSLSPQLWLGWRPGAGS